jgi:Tfp pilus assembly protein PilN
MDETDAVLRRLARIERLAANAATATLLEELRRLVPEAEAWARVEGDVRARAAVEKLRQEAEGMR